MPYILLWDSLGTLAVYGQRLAEAASLRLAAPRLPATPSPESLWGAIDRHQASLVLTTLPLDARSHWVRTLWTAPCPVLFVPPGFTGTTPPGWAALLADGEAWEPGWTVAAALSVLQPWRPVVSAYLLTTSEQSVRSPRGQQAQAQWAVETAELPTLLTAPVVATPATALEEVLRRVNQQPVDLLIAVARRRNLPRVAWTRKALYLLLSQSPVPVLVIPE